MKKSSLITIITSVTLLIFIIFSGEKSINFAKNSFYDFINIVFPSVFPFMVASGMLIRSGILLSLSKKLNGLSYSLFNVCGHYIYVLFCSLLSSYPNGVKMSCELYDLKLISKEETVKMINSSSICGPLFISGVVCTSVLGNISLTPYFIFSQTISLILTAVIFNRLSGTSKHITTIQNIKNSNTLSLGEAFTSSISSAFSVCISILGYMVIFGILSGCIREFTVIYINNNASLLPSFLCGFLEMSNGCLTLTDTDAGFISKAVLAAFITGFGGLSIIFQSYGIMALYNIKNRAFVFIKLFQGALNALFIYIIFSNITVEVFMQTKKYTQQSNISLSIFIIILFTLFYILFKRTKN